MLLRGLAIPYGTPSIGGVDGDPLNEIVRPGAFAAAVVAGTTRSGEPIYATWDHSRKRADRIGDTRDGRLRLHERADGVWFTLAGVRRPQNLTGVSVTLRPIRWRRGRGLLKELLEADLVHVALLRKPHGPAYPGTLATIEELND